MRSGQQTGSRHPLQQPFNLQKHFNLQQPFIARSRGKKWPAVRNTSTAVALQPFLH
jgi:hypothetical protein